MFYLIADVRKQLNISGIPRYVWSALSLNVFLKLKEETMAITAIADNSKEKKGHGEPINYKGQPCPFKPITCQEGYCTECNIYLSFLKRENEKGFHTN